MTNSPLRPSWACVLLVAVVVAHAPAAGAQSVARCDDAAACGGAGTQAAARDADAPAKPDRDRGAPAEPAGGETNVKLSGYVQADLVPWDERSSDGLDASGASRNQTRALIRRARLQASVTRDRYVGSLELDGNTVDGATARLIGALVGARWTRGRLEATIGLGLFKLPFGRELPAAESAREVLEPTTSSRAFFPGSRDSGAIATARWRGLEAAVALTNGTPLGDARFRGRDPSSRWELVGRVGGRGTLRHGVVLSGGLSLVTGSGLHAGTPATEDTLAWVDANQDGVVQLEELQVVPGAPATPAQRFTRSAVGADVAVTWCLRRLGSGVAQAEVAVATNLDRGVEYADPIAADRDLRALGWQLLIAQSLTRHAQLAVRYDVYRPDRDLQVPSDPRYRTIAIAGELRRATARLIAEYDHDVVPGPRGPDGTPTTRAVDRVTLRAQVGF